jgi:hypothetical protein
VIIVKNRPTSRTGLLTDSGALRIDQLKSPRVKWPFRFRKLNPQGSQQFRATFVGLSGNVRLRPRRSRVRELPQGQAAHPAMPGEVRTSIAQLRRVVMLERAIRRTPAVVQCPRPYSSFRIRHPPVSIRPESVRPVLEQDTVDRVQ